MMANDERVEEIRARRQRHSDVLDTGGTELALIGEDIDWLLDALTQAEDRHAETRGLVRDLTITLEKRNGAIAQAEREIEHWKEQTGKASLAVLDATTKLAQAERDVQTWKDMGEKEHALAVLFANEKEQAEREREDDRRLHDAWRQDILVTLKQAERERDRLGSERDELREELCEARAEVERLKADVKQLAQAILWADGQHEDFRPREPGEGAFWWRKELMQRSGLRPTRAALEGRHD